jgi:hypothetical protein
MKIEILNRYTNAVMFALEADSKKQALESAVKSSANLSGANLRGADLSSANLSSADLSSADLSSANLRGADLSSANLSSANLEKSKGIYQIVPEVGAFVGFKKLADGVIAKLQIPEDAQRVGGYTGRKCRAEKAIVLEGEGVSQYDSKFTYAVGQVIVPDKWDNDPRVECSHGIHFFLSRQEAADYA